MKLSILLFEEVDLLDVGGPYEVFLTANRIRERGGIPSPFQLSTVTLNDEPVTAYGGMGLVPNAKIDQLMLSDVLIVPGTINIDKATANSALVHKVKTFATKSGHQHVIASVCTGAFLLAEAGLLLNRHWTTHFEDIDLLADKLGSNKLENRGARKNVPWVDSGTVVTAGGLSHGMDMALHLVERFTDRALAESTAKQIEYRWGG